MVGMVQFCVKIAKYAAIYITQDPHDQVPGVIVQNTGNTYCIQIMIIPLTTVWSTSTDPLHRLMFTLISDSISRNRISPSTNRTPGGPYLGTVSIRQASWPVYKREALIWGPQRSGVAQMLAFIIIKTVHLVVDLVVSPSVSRLRLYGQGQVGNIAYKTFLYMTPPYRPIAGPVSRTKLVGISTSRY